MRDRKTRLIARFKDRQYRHAYTKALLNTRVAAQLKALREDRSLSQADLAKKLRTTQSAISRMENVNYSAWSLKTLRKLARVFDVGLQVQFVPFSAVVAQAERLDAATLAPPAFKDDKALLETRVFTSYTATIESHIALPYSMEAMDKLLHSVRPIQMGYVTATSPVANSNVPAAAFSRVAAGR